MKLLYLLNNLLFNKPTEKMSD